MVLLASLIITFALIIFINYKKLISYLLYSFTYDHKYNLQTWQHIK